MIGDRWSVVGGRWSVFNSFHATDFCEYLDQLIVCYTFVYFVYLHQFRMQRFQWILRLFSFIIRMEIVSCCWCCLHSSLWCHCHLLSVYSRWIHYKIFNWLNLLLLFSQSLWFVIFFLLSISFRSRSLSLSHLLFNLPHNWFSIKALNGRFLLYAKYKNNVSYKCILTGLFSEYFTVPYSPHVGRALSFSTSHFPIEILFFHSSSLCTLYILITWILVHRMLKSDSITNLDGILNIENWVSRSEMRTIECCLSFQFEISQLLRFNRNVIQ